MSYLIATNSIAWTNHKLGSKQAETVYFITLFSDLPPKRQGETPPKRQVKSKHLTNVVPAATAVNLKWKWKHQCKVDGHRRADNYFQEDWWSRRCFLQAVHFLQTLSEGCRNPLTKPNITVRRRHCLAITPTCNSLNQDNVVCCCILHAVLLRCVFFWFLFHCLLLRYWASSVNITSKTSTLTSWSISTVLSSRQEAAAAGEPMLSCHISPTQVRVYQFPVGIDGLASLA